MRIRPSPVGSAFPLRTKQRSARAMEAWAKPEDCGSWEDEVIAQLIHGVLQIGTGD